jgi:hypothetical protein
MRQTCTGQGCGQGWLDELTSASTLLPVWVAVKVAVRQMSSGRQRGRERLS